MNTKIDYIICITIMCFIGKAYADRGQIGNVINVGYMYIQDGAGGANDSDFTK